MSEDGRKWPDRILYLSAARAGGLVFLALLAAALTVAARLQVSSFYPVKAAALFAAIAATAAGHLRAHHPFPRLGPANSVTMLRAAMTASIVALIGEDRSPGALWGVIAVGTLVAVLDGVDGWLARRTRMVSRFGTRFDIEIDALLILGLAILAWLDDKAGMWVLMSGLLRYLFVGAGWIWPALRAPLEPSRRRQTICVMQIVALLAVVAPALAPPLSTTLAAGALLALAWSFLVDTLWLLGARTASRWATLAAALVLLDASLTFTNIWPTPFVSWDGEMSLELAVVLLVMAVVVRRPQPLSRAVVRGFTALWMLLLVGRYADVTAPALYGREINLYWDLRYVPDVAAMLAKAAPAWVVALAVVGAATMLLLVWVAVGRILRFLGSAFNRPGERRTLVFASALLVAAFVAQRAAAISFEPAGFATPVVQTYLRQVSLVIEAAGGSRTLPPGPAMESDLALVSGADVCLVFVESYGAVTFERPELADRLEPARARFEQVARATSRDVVSAFVESPTFGGSSWLAHISLLTGIEVRDQGLNARLMTQKRATMVQTFARRGYRTVAVMPGLWYPWPEGEFYGFDEIYTGERLDYRGPPFGWWTIPDQFTLARLKALEISATPRRPVFIFFPTVSTHTPFAPTPPYQADWRRALTPNPYDPEELEQAYAQEPDWMDLSPAYASAVAYEFTALAGFLQQIASRDLVLIVVGDHQPPALVSGEGASWNVPVHIVAGRPVVLDRLIARGFERGMKPATPDRRKMHELLPLLLATFGSQ
jgi:phosphatidylglycerophosphate synthase